MKKIIAILLLSVAMTIGAAACGGSEIALEESGTGMAAAAATASAAAADGDSTGAAAGASTDVAVDTMGEEETIETPTQEESQICVYVCGAVVTPGVYALPEGSRIYEALELAGGLTAEADIGVVNQAQELTDGMMIRIPAAGESSTQDTIQTADPAADAATVTSTVSGLVHINTADAAQLMTLPGIGEAKAAAILQYRNQYGSFASKEDLLNVPGIGSATYRNLESQIAVP